MSDTHRELRCTIPSCPFDMRDDKDTQRAVFDYLMDLASAVHHDEIRHVSISVHRAEGKSL